MTVTMHQQQRGVETRARIYEFMKRYQERAGIPPTQEYIGRALGLSREAVRGQLVRMEILGLVKRTHSQTWRRYEAI